jgi:hypothetical protein
MVKILLALVVVVLVVSGFVWHDVRAKADEPSPFDPQQQSEPAPLPLKKRPDVVIPPAPSLVAKSMSRNLPVSGHWRGKPAIVDLNGDGRADLVASIRREAKSQPGEGLHVWLNDGADGWNLMVNGMRRDLGYGGAEVGDVNGDGRPDVAFSGHDGLPQIYVNYLNVDPPSWVSTTERGIGDNLPCADVALGDLNRDGKCDLAVLGQFSRGAGLEVYYGDGSGGMSDPVQVLEPLIYGAQVMMRDVDGDGHLELIATTMLGPKVWSYDAAQGLVDRSDGLPQPEVGGADLGLDVADLDGDGRAELLVAGIEYPKHPALRLYRFDGSSWTDWGEGLPTGETFLDAGFAHIDDGPPVILAANGIAGVSVIRMTSPGVFERIGRIAGTGDLFNFGVGDVDGDGRDEITVVGFHGVRVFELDSVVASSNAEMK